MLLCGYSPGDFYLELWVTPRSKDLGAGVEELIEPNPAA